MTGRKPLDVGTVIDGDVRVTSVVEDDALGFRYLVEIVADRQPGELIEFLPRSLACRDAHGIMVAARPEQSDSLELCRARFLAEAALLRALPHPNLVPILRAFEHQGAPCLVMPCAAGQTLAEKAVGQVRLPSQDELDELVAPLVSALSSLHARNLFHCNVGPQTILIGEHGQPMLVGFGGTRALVAALTRTVDDCVTAGYSAPELYLSDASAHGAACDVYSLAAMLYRLVTGRAPVDVFQRNIGAAMSPATTARGSYRPGFLATIDAGLALDPAARPLSIEAFGRRLLGGDATVSPAVALARQPASPPHAAGRGSIAPPLATSTAAASSPDLTPPPASALSRAAGAPLAPSASNAAGNPGQAAGLRPSQNGPVGAAVAPAAVPRRMWAGSARFIALAAGLALLAGLGIGWLDQQGGKGVKSNDQPVPAPAVATAPPARSVEEAPKTPGAAVEATPAKPAGGDEARRPGEELARQQQKEQFDAEIITANRARERNARLAAIAQTSDRDSLLALADSDKTLLPQLEERLAVLGFVRATAGQRLMWVRPGHGEAFRDCEICPELVAVPPPVKSPARTAKATPASTSPQASAPVAIDVPLAVGRFEVTRDEFAAFIADTGYETAGGCHARRPGWQLDPELSWKEPGFEQTGRHPVVCVSFDDAQAYVAWLNLRTKADYRLLTEDEWDHAARSGTATALRFPFGKDDSDICTYANGADKSAAQVNPDWKVADCTDGYAATAPVGSFKPNHFGLFDTLGNVWEWVDTCAPAPDSIDKSRPVVCTSKNPRFLKGGSFSDRSDLLEPSARSGAEPGVRDEIVGFRVVRSLQRQPGKGAAQ